MDKVFGVGLPKTGTKTLKYALMELGYDKPKKCKQKYTQLYDEGKFGKLHSIANKANNVSDSPWWLMYKKLHHWFPDSHFILTVRKTPDAWYKSVIKHITTRGMSALNFKNVFDMDINNIDEKKLKAIYNNHNTEVREYFKGNRNFIEVCWEQDDGWYELCPFLDAPVPKKDFPWKNNSSKK